jgi:molecular chaperone GrpE
MIHSKKEKLEKEKLKNEMKELEIPVTDSNETDAGENVSEEINTEEINTEENIPSSEGQVNELREQLLRKAAEFENYKRRTEAEKSDYYSYANEKLIGQLLPVLDDLSRALNAYDENHDGKSLKKGVELINDKFKKILEKQGLKEIDSTGKDFDVHLHEALMQQPSDKVKPNKVIDTIEKGYHLKDKVLRHAKVIVSAKPE